MDVHLWKKTAAVGGTAGERPNVGDQEKLNNFERLAARFDAFVSSRSCAYNRSSETPPCWLTRSKSFSWDMGAFRILPCFITINFSSITFDIGLERLSVSPASYSFGRSASGTSARWILGSHFRMSAICRPKRVRASRNSVSDLWS